MLELIDRNDKITISEIAVKFETVAENTISTLISNLCKAKLVSKDRDYDNQRIVHVSLTRKGRGFLDAIRKERGETICGLVDALKLNLKQEEMLAEVVDKVKVALDENMCQRNL